MAKLVLVRGIPGSGKSTFAKTHYRSFIHLESDMFFMKDGEYKFDYDYIKEAHDWCFETCEIFLNNHFDVVVSNIFIKKWEVERYVNVAKQLNIPYEIHTMTGNFGSIHNVPEEKIAQMIKNWEIYPAEIKHNFTD